MTGTVEAVENARRAGRSAFQHLAAMQAPTVEVNRPFDEVAAVYQCELARLSAAAAVLDYLPVLVMKRIRRLYLHRLEVLYKDDPCQCLIGGR